MHYFKPGSSHFLPLGIILALFFFAVSCDINDADDNATSPGDIGVTGNSTTYSIEPTGTSNLVTSTGTVRLEELNDGSTVISVDIGETVSGAEHPLHIRSNAAVEGGQILITLNPVDGNTGTSETPVSEFNDGTPVRYSNLITLDGHISVDFGEGNDADVIARGDIGDNRLTGESESYDLEEKNNSGISGSIQFEERNNSNTLVTIDLNGTTPGVDHPAFIYNNSVEEGGDIAISLGRVDGATGIGQANIRADEEQSGNATYTALVNFDGHVNVHLSEDDFTPIASGNIGSNEEELPEEDDEDDEDDNGDNDDDNGGDF